MALQRLPTAFEEAMLFVPDVFADERGFFSEAYSEAKYRALGLADVFPQDSFSRSSRNVIRGLHFDPAMSKLVHVARGRIFDVILDVRPESTTYGRWQGFDLSDVNHHQLYVPRGFAHGFLALADDVLVAYKQGALYDPARERCVRWNDPAVGIAWPLEGEPILSPKDRAAPTLAGVRERARAGT